MAVAAHLIGDEFFSRDAPRVRQQRIHPLQVDALQAAECRLRSVTLGALGQLPVRQLLRITRVSGYRQARGVSAQGA